ncbi:MAG TPA: hypothetical protein VHE35_11600 [Kofleriaceae bacterium]|nr:hypothetical protein [Kofleriaceae bacterium]
MSVATAGACAPHPPPVDPRSPFEIDDPRAQPGYVAPVAPETSSVARRVDAAASPAAPCTTLRLFRVHAVGAAHRLDGKLVEVLDREAAGDAVTLAAGDVLVAGDGCVLDRGIRLRGVGDPSADELAGAAPLTLWAAGRTPPKPPTHVGLAVKVSALGAGVDVAVPLGGRVNVRGGFSTFWLEDGYADEGVHYHGRLMLRSVSASLDWFPFGGNWHLSPGVMLCNGNRASGVASVPAGEVFHLHHADLLSAAADPVSATAVVEYERIAPAIVIGWGNIVPRGRRRWSIPVEVGVVYSRAPTTAISLRGTACDPDGHPCRNITGDDLVDSQVELEEEEIDAKLARYRVLPIVSIGFGYKF